MEEYERLKEVVASAEEDVIRADKGNKAAGTRVRKSMQDVKKAAQDVRNKVLELRQQGEQPPAPPAPPSPSF
ncbi:MAG: histone H1 [Planctomycetes bacterium]|nr:histone H1 [Planctomycetota bacterium]